MADEWKVLDDEEAKAFLDEPEEEAGGVESVSRFLGSGAIRQIAAAPFTLGNLVTEEAIDSGPGQRLMGPLDEFAGEFGVESGTELLPGRVTERALHRAADTLREGASEDWKRAAEKPVLKKTDDNAPWWDLTAYETGEGLTDIRSLTAKSAESLPGTVGMWGLAAGAGRKVFKDRLKAELSRGVPAGEARKRAADAAASTGMRVGGTAEGVMSGGMNAEAVEEEIRRLPEEQLMEVPTYAEARREGLSHEAAVRKVARKPAIVSGFLTGAVTGVLGGPVNARITRLFTEGPVRGRAAAIAGAGAAEAATEALQSFQEKVGENLGVRTVDPDRDIFAGAIPAAAEGFVLGGILGSGAGAIAPGAGRQKAKEGYERYTEAAAKRREYMQALKDAGVEQMDRQQHLDYLELHRQEMEALYDNAKQAYDHIWEQGEEEVAANREDVQEAVTAMDLASATLPAIREKLQRAADPQQAEPASFAEPQQEFDALDAIAAHEPVDEPAFRALEQAGHARMMGENLMLTMAGKRRRKALRDELAQTQRPLDKEVSPDAQPLEEAGPDDAGRGARPEVREEGRDTEESGEEVRPGGQEEEGPVEPPFRSARDGGPTDIEEYRRRREGEESDEQTGDELDALLENEEFRDELEEEMGVPLDTLDEGTMDAYREWKRERRERRDKVAEAAARIRRLQPDYDELSSQVNEAYRQRSDTVPGAGPLGGMEASLAQEVLDFLSPTAVASREVTRASQVVFDRVAEADIPQETLDSAYEELTGNPVEEGDEVSLERVLEQAMAEVAEDPQAYDANDGGPVYRQMVVKRLQELGLTDAAGIDQEVLDVAAQDIYWAEETDEPIAIKAEEWGDDLPGADLLPPLRASRSPDDIPKETWRDIKSAMDERDYRRAYRLYEEARGIERVDSSFDRGENVHAPAGPEDGAPLYDVTRDVYPEDVYGPNGLRFYGTGEDALDQKAYNIIRDAEGKPGKKVRVYRAVEKGHKGGIKPGDWVTTVRAYAKDHGEGNVPDGYRIISKTVEAKDIYTSGDSWLEWGYHPQTQPTISRYSLRRRAEHATKEDRQPRAQTETPAFKRWFGDSKVVDENGEPLVVYHGTTAAEDFSDFSVGERVDSPDSEVMRLGSGADPTTYLGSHFAKERAVANKFAKGLYGERSGQPEGGRVMPVYLKIVNPYKTTEEAMRDEMMRGEYNHPYIDYILERDGDIEETGERYEADLDYRKEVNERVEALTLESPEPDVSLAEDMAQQYRTRLIEQGYDGIIYENAVEGGTSYVAFRPEQIKSAVGNRGTFDATDPSILRKSKEESEEEVRRQRRKKAAKKPTPRKRPKKKSKADAFLDQWHRGTQAHPKREGERVFDWSESASVRKVDDTTVRIDSSRAFDLTADDRGKAMGKLVRMANRHGVTLELRAAVEEHAYGMTRKQLVDWLHENGFRFVVEGGTIHADRLRRPPGVTKRYSEKKTNAGAGMKVADVERAIRQRYGAMEGSLFQVVEAAEDLPGALLGVLEQIPDGKGGTPAMYVPSPFEDRIYVVANNVRDEADLAETLVHETVAHYGLRGLLGETRHREFMLEVAKAFPQEVRRAIKRNDLAHPSLGLTKEEQQVYGADEFIAYLAQRELDGDTLMPKEKNLLERIIEMLREVWMRVTGQGRQAATRKRILTYLARAAEHIHNGDLRHRSKKGMLHRSARPDWYYSALTRYVEEKGPNTAAPKAWREFLEAGMKKGHFKQDEYEWAYLDTLLEDVRTIGDWVDLDMPYDVTAPEYQEAHAALKDLRIAHASAIREATERVTKAEDDIRRLEHLGKLSKSSRPYRPDFPLGDNAVSSVERMFLPYDGETLAEVRRNIAQALRRVRREFREAMREHKRLLDELGITAKQKERDQLKKRPIKLSKSMVMEFLDRFAPQVEVLTPKPDFDDMDVVNLDSADLELEEFDEEFARENAMEDIDEDHATLVVNNDAAAMQEYDEIAEEDGEEAAERWLAERVEETRVQLVDERVEADMEDHYENGRLHGIYSHHEGGDFEVIFDRMDDSWTIDGQGPFTESEAEDYIAQEVQTSDAFDGYRKWEKYSVAGLDDYFELLFKWNNPKNAPGYALEAHWDHLAEDLIAHARGGYRYDREGNKVLYIDEIQSDWQQAIRESGLADREGAVRLQEEAKAIEAAFWREHQGLWEALQDKTRAERAGRFNDRYLEALTGRWVEKNDVRPITRELNEFGAPAAIEIIRELLGETVRTARLVDAASVLATGMNLTSHLHQSVNVVNLWEWMRPDVTAQDALSDHVFFARIYAELDEMTPRGLALKLAQVLDETLGDRGISREEAARRGPNDAFRKYVEQAQRDYRKNLATTLRRLDLHGDYTEAMAEAVGREPFTSYDVLKAFGIGELVEEKTKEEVRRTALEVEERIQKARAKMDGIPPAPFAKAWPVVVMKRLIREAIDNGATRIALSPGAVHGIRWNDARVMDRTEDQEVFLKWDKLTEPLHMKDEDGYVFSPSGATILGFTPSEGSEATSFEDFVAQEPVAIGGAVGPPSDAGGLKGASPTSPYFMHRLIVPRRRLRHALGQRVGSYVEQALESGGGGMTSASLLGVDSIILPAGSDTMMGSRAFYDEIAPNLMNRFLKKFKTKLRPVEFELSASLFDVDDTRRATGGLVEEERRAEDPSLDEAEVVELSVYGAMELVSDAYNRFIEKQREDGDPIIYRVDSRMTPERAMKLLEMRTDGFSDETRRVLRTIYRSALGHPAVAPDPSSHAGGKDVFAFIRKGPKDETQASLAEEVGGEARQLVDEAFTVTTTVDIDVVAMWLGTREAKQALEDKRDGKPIIFSVNTFDITDKLKAASEAGEMPLFSRRKKQRAKMLAKIGQRRKGLREIWEAVKSDLKARTLQGIFDQFYSLIRAERAAGIPMAESAYVSARLSTGVESVVRSMMEFGFPVWDSEDMVSAAVTYDDSLGGGFLEMLRAAKGNPERMEDFKLYIVAKRAKRLKEEGREKLFDEADIEYGLSLAEADPFLEEMAQKMAAFNSKVLDFAEKAGVIDPESRKLWESADYVPFYRILEDTVQGPFQGSGLANTPKLIRRLTGSTARIGDPLENMVQNLTTLISAAMKNQAARLAVDNLDGTGLITRPKGQEYVKQVMVPLDQVKKHLEKQGVDPDILPEEALQGIGKMMALSRPEGDDVMWVLRDGKREYWHVHDPLLFRAMTNIGRKEWPKELMEIFRFPKRLLTGSITLAPGFQVKNFFRDALHTFVISKTRVTPGADSAAGILKAVTKSRTMREMMAGGASFESGYMSSHDPSSIDRRIRAEMRKGDFRSSVLDSPLRLFEAYRSFSSAVENAHRIAIYDRTLAQTGSRKMALYEAKDIMDFSMRGENGFIRFLAESVPFWNARVQGLYRGARSVVGPNAVNPWGVLFRGSLITLASVGLMLKYRDDDRYKELNEWDKSFYYHFWIGDQHWRLPRPFEVGAVFGNIPELFTEYMLSQEPDKGKQLGRSLYHVLAEQLSLAPHVQTLTPFVELKFNRNFFTDRPILYFWEKSQLPETQYSPAYTRPTARWLAEKFRFSQELTPSLASPKQLEHLLRGYTGTLGDYAMLATDAVVRQMEDYPAPPTRRLDEMPFVKVFRRNQPPKSTKYLTEMYRILEDADKVYTSIRRYDKEERFEEADRLRKEHEQLLYSREVMGDAKDEITKINKDIREAMMSETMTPDEKRERIDRLLEEKMREAESVYPARPGGPRNMSDAEVISAIYGRTKSDASDTLAEAGLPKTGKLVSSLPNTPSRRAAGVFADIVEQEP